jgi:hypothetical protein
MRDGVEESRSRGVEKSVGEAPGMGVVILRFAQDLVIPRY